MIAYLEQWDRQLFLWLNGLHQPWLDQAMYYMSEGWFWIPVYLLLLWLVAKAYNWKTALWSLLGIAAVVFLADRSSVELFKEVFQRYRPTHNLEIADLVHTVNGYRGGRYGFVSSHAANYFGITTFLFMLLRKRFAKWAWLLFVWAALICYTRIYLGVHYPADILGGSLLGVLIGLFVYWIFKRLILNRK